MAAPPDPLRELLLNNFLREALSRLWVDPHSGPAERRSQILIMDESTASVDAETDEAIPDRAGTVASFSRIVPLYVLHS